VFLRQRIWEEKRPFGRPQNGDVKAEEGEEEEEGGDGETNNKFMSDRRVVERDEDDNKVALSFF
jgi:hypothetical protein